MKNTNIHTMLREHFKKLPPKLQSAITSTEIADTLRAIAQKYKLHIDQGQILENETYMVLLGVEQAGSYQKNLEKELGISTELAQKIYTDVAKDIFLAIRDSLKETTTPEATAPQEVANAQPKPVEPLQSYQKTTPETKEENSHNKLETVVKNQSKTLEISPTKKYTVDPYREPIE